MSSTNIRDLIEKNESGYFNITDLGDFIRRAFSFILVIGSIATLLYLLWGALSWIISQGDKEKLEKARNQLTNAIIGLTILACIWLIWRIVLTFLGIGTVSPQRVEFK